MSLFLSADRVGYTQRHVKLTVGLLNKQEQLDRSCPSFDWAMDSFPSPVILEVGQMPQMPDRWVALTATSCDAVVACNQAKPEMVVRRDPHMLMGVAMP